MPRLPLEVGTWGNINRVKAGERWRVFARFRDADGVTRQVEAWGKTGAAAERALKKKFADRATAAGDQVVPATRVSALADLWLRSKVKPSKLATNTKRRSRITVENAIIPGIGGLMVRECTVARLDTWLKKYATQVGEPSAKIARTCLLGMFGIAVREGALPQNPARDTETIEAETDKEARALSDAEVAKLRATLRDDRKAVAADLPDLVDIMLSTGCRIGEALAIQWDQVDLDAGVLWLTGTVVRPDEGGPLVRQDTTKGRKVTGIWLPMWCVEMLEARAKAVGFNDLGLVFPSTAGTMRDASNTARQWRSFRGRHPEWDWTTAKVFRKTVATKLAKHSGPQAAAEQLAHSNAAVTIKHYIERPDTIEDRSSLLEGWGVSKPEAPET